MSINYRLYQDNRKNSKKKGHWYARTVVTNCVDIKALAARISNSCTVTEPDILAVISALVFEMNQVLKSGSRVKIDGLGTFRVSFHSQGVEDAKDFNVQKNIYGAHVLFAPSVTVDTMHRRIKTLISGLRIQEAVKYDAPEKGKAKEPGKTPGKDQKPGGNTPSGGPQAGDTTGGDEAGTHPQG